MVNGTLARWRSEPSLLLASSLVLLVVGWHLWVNPSNPPGFVQDEAAISTNALAIATTGRDQYGDWMPLFFRSFDDYKSPEYVYLLAAAFRITGPSQEVARGLSAVLILAAVACFALLARRQSGSRRVGVGLFVLAGTTPWLFEVGRLAFEVALEPVLIVLLFLLLERCVRETRWTYSSASLVGLVLGAIAYSYAAGRLYAMLLALVVPLAAGLRRPRFVAVVWGVFAIMLLPIAAHLVRHPGALSSRFEDTTFIETGMSTYEIAVRFLDNYYGYFDLPHWVLVGDPDSRHHVPGAGSLSAIVVVLALASVVILVRSSRLDGFWRFALAATLLAPVPAALTGDAFHSLRSLPLAVGLLVLTIPALEAVDRALVTRERWARPLGVTLVVLWLAGVAQFSVAFLGRGPDREAGFHAGVPELLDRGTREEGRLYVAPGDLVALGHARWFADVNDLPPDRIGFLAASADPPRGALVFGSVDECVFPCTVVSSADNFWLARAM